MKFILLFFAVAFFYSCQTNNCPKKVLTDSISVKNNSINTLTEKDRILEDLLLIKNEKELKQIFGAKNVTTDTIWGAEGMFYMKTKLFRNSLDEVIITWEDTINHSHLISVGVRCFYNNISSKTIFKNNWKSKTGISLGTSLSELVMLNGKDFSFFGLGWDYSGGITSWDGGKLENQGIGITLGTETYNQLSKEYKNILGNSELSSSNPNAKKVNPIVVELYISTTN